MARPWEYPGWRRVLMQAVMWLVFAGSLGLAQLVAHNRGLSVGPLVRAGPFVIQLPEGFSLKAGASNLDLVAEDPTRGQRLFILRRPLRSEGRGLSPRYEGDIPIEFRGLHVMGTMGVRQSPHSGGDPEMFDTTLLATAPLPMLRRTIVVGLELGDGELNAADQSLLRRIVGSIELAGSDSRAPAPPPTSGDDVVRETAVDPRLQHNL